MPLTHSLLHGLPTVPLKQGPSRCFGKERSDRVRIVVYLPYDSENKGSQPLTEVLVSYQPSVSIPEIKPWSVTKPCTLK